jgi:Phosphotransferase system cellobiose-specific component IIB
MMMQLPGCPGRGFIPAMNNLVFSAGSLYKKNQGVEIKIFLGSIAIMKNILLICGSGASSGFMAASIRKAAKKEKMQIKVKASSESQLDDQIDQIDLLLIGPHLSYILDDLKKEN